MTMVSKKKIISLVSLVLLLISVFALPAFAYDYSAVVEDNAALLTEDQIMELGTQMVKLTQYGDVLFYSTNGNDMYGYSAKSVCEYKYGNNHSAIIFYINMSSRKLTVYVNGAAADMVSAAKCTTIADNVYKLASNKKYLDCAKKAFDQLLGVIEGKKINSPMQLASNICLAIIVSMIINYFLIKILHGNRKMNNLKLVENSGNYVWFKDLYSGVVYSSRRFSPRSKNHGGSGGFGGGGGGFGGGGHGGSHSF